MKTLFTILTIASLAFLSSCDLLDNDPELPPITTEGKNTFGCYVNGKLFLPEAPFGYGAGVRAELLVNDTITTVNIYASNTTTKQTLIISLFDKPNLQVGKIYQLSTANLTIDYVDYSKEISCYYNSIINADITLLKFDISNPGHKIVAGTFAFTLYSSECMTTIETSEGRFDISNF